MADGSGYVHVLERRSQMLANAVTSRIDNLTTSLQPPGSRPPFTTMLSDRKAIDWWLDNYTNPQTGGAILQRMQPEQQLELHNALSEHIKSNGLVSGMGGAQSGVPFAPSAPALPVTTPDTSLPPMPSGAPPMLPGQPGIPA